MRPRHPHAAESGVGKHTARESERVQACAAGKERVTNAHPRGWAFVTRSFPAAHAWTRSLSRAVCFPTPLSAACGCLGLMAGPS